MFGRRKLSEIKRTVRETLQADPKVKEWLDSKLKQASAGTNSGEAVAEDLLWVQKYLEETVEDEKSAARRIPRKVVAKKTRRRAVASR